METNKEVRVLTLKQPFASLMLEGKIETRKWDTKYRGPVLIHCGLQPYPIDELQSMCSMEQFEFLCEYIKDRRTQQFFGHAIAIGNLVDCEWMEREHEKKAYVEYHSDLFAWHIEDVKPIVPFRMRGTQGFRRLQPAEIAKIQLAQTTLTL